MITRRVATVLGALLVMAIALQGGAAVADHTPTVTGHACVTDTEFRFHIQGNNVSVDPDLFNNQSIRGETPSEAFIVYLSVTGASTVTVNTDNGVSGDGTKWATGKFSHTITATRLSETDDYAWYDIVMDGIIPHGTVPYVSGNTWGPAIMLDKELGAAIQGTNLTITDCEEPPTSSTVAPTSSTVAPTSSTVAPTSSTVAPTSSTVSPTVAPTSIVSTTIPEVETDIASGDGTTPAVLALAAAGFLTLVAVAVRARRFER